MNNSCNVTKEGNKHSALPTSAFLSDALSIHYNKYNVNIGSLVSPIGVTITNDGDDGGVRFIRLNPRFDVEETLKLLKYELGDHEPIPITWLDFFNSGEGLKRNDLKFFSIPEKFALVRSSCYKSGRIYGMDVSSGAAVSALLLLDSKGDDGPMNILDLCCSPGLKLCTIVDLLEQRRYNLRRLNEDKAINVSSDDGMDLVVGVDVSSSRMNLCKKVIHKYLFDAETSGACRNQDIGTLVRLFCTDGTTFGCTKDGHYSSTRSLMSLHGKDLVFDSRSLMEEEKRILSFETIKNPSPKRKRMNKSARAREKRSLRHAVASSENHGLYQKQDVSCEGGSAQKNAPQQYHPLEFFDRVLVDAECSTDGSIKHLEQQVKKMRKINNGSATNNNSVVAIENQTLTEKQKLMDLVNLQRRLILSGFRLLKRGGLMVYSTCSLSREQNEDVVSWLLEEEKKNAFLIPVVFHDVSTTPMISVGFIKGTVRFKPCIGVECNTLKVYGGGFFLAKLGKR